VNTDLYTDTPTPSVCWRWVFRGALTNAEAKD